jgi:hypothetical protein
MRLTRYPRGHARVCVCCAWVYGPSDVCTETMQERTKIADLSRQLAAVDREISEAKSALGRFRAEFEQLRVALLVDRMAKSSQVSALVTVSASWQRTFIFRDGVLAQARQRVLDNETKYACCHCLAVVVSTSARPVSDSRGVFVPLVGRGVLSGHGRPGLLQSAQLGKHALPVRRPCYSSVLNRCEPHGVDGDPRVVRGTCDFIVRFGPLCVFQVKASLTEQYQAGFRPLLAEADERHREQVKAVAELQRVLEDKGGAACLDLCLFLPPILCS